MKRTKISVSVGTVIVLLVVSLLTGGAIADGNALIGDIDLDGDAYTTKDLLMFGAYFLIGPAAFSGHLAESSEASDINLDGRRLTVSDLMLGIFVAAGMHDPHDPPPVESPNIAYFAQDMVNGTINLSTDDSLGAVWLEFKGKAIPADRPDLITIQYEFDGVMTRVLMYEYNSFTFLTGGVIYTYVGDGELTTVSAATYDARYVECVIDNQSDVIEGPEST
ncbi:MAG: hypothetical protein V3T31_09740, partial [candidate division Zixibacteria bacterium]